MCWGFAIDGRVPGALNGLMAEIMEGQVRFHVLSPDRKKNSPEMQAAEELIDVIRAYLK
jgi:DNA-binding FrmR family transcriptional regulator